MVIKEQCTVCGSFTIKHSRKAGCYNCGSKFEGRVKMNYFDSACPVIGCSSMLFKGKCMECSRVPYLARMGKPVKAPEVKAESPDVLHDNVGNCLAKLIPEWAVGSKKGCKCKDIQAKLNRWGTKGCEDNIEWIVTKMVGQKKYLRGALKMVPDGVAEGGVRWLVNKAIKMSKEK